MIGYRLTTQMRRVLAMAREEAERLHHEYIGTEHILLRLIRQGDSIAAAVLRNLSVDLDDVQLKIEETVKKGRNRRTIGPDLPYTSRAKKVLELAMMEAKELHHDYVGTEHLLLGLLREEKGIAAQMLHEFGAELEPVRQETLRLLGGPSATRERPGGAGRADRRPTGARRMNLEGVLTVSAIYLAVLGVGFMFAPRQIGIDAVPADPSPALIAYLRVFGGPFLGIAVLNWLARNAEPSAARNAIVLANIVGFGCAASMDVWGVLIGGGARPIAKLFLVVHLLMTVAFVVAGRASMRAKRG